MSPKGWFRARSFIRIRIRVRIRIRIKDQFFHFSNTERFGILDIRQDHDGTETAVFWEPWYKEQSIAV